MDGFDVLKSLKADPKTAKIPVIILTNLGDISNIEKALEVGRPCLSGKGRFPPGGCPQEGGRDILRQLKRN